MTDSMNFGPEWLRNLSSEGTTTGINNYRCQLADYRYGREEMLALFEKGVPPPPSLTTFPPLYSEQVLPPLALVPATEEERQWASRGPPMPTSLRAGRGAPGGPSERGGRMVRGSTRGGYQSYGRTIGGGYEGGSGGGGGWAGTAEQTEWSPRKDFTYNRSTSSGGIDNWRRNNRGVVDEDEGWRSSSSHGRGGGSAEKWTRSSSWREGDDEVREKRWHEPNSSGQRGGSNHRRLWDAQDEHLPEWATENLEGGGTFDSSGAFHGSDDEHERDKGKELQKSASQQNMRSAAAPLVTSKSAIALTTSKKDREEKKPREVLESGENNIKEEKEHVSELRDQITTHCQQLPGAIDTTKNGMSNFLPATSVSSPPDTNNANLSQSNNTMLNEQSSGVVDEDFDKLQEDFVSKLVVDEEPPKSTNAPLNIPISNGIPAPPPNIRVPPISIEKWYYQDPQGDLQGPFLAKEMADWFKAGYFSMTLLLRRMCDERFITLGELVSLCSGGNPFVVSVPMPPLKSIEKIECQSDLSLRFQAQQFMHSHMMRSRGFGQGEPWNNLPPMQRDMFTGQPMIPPIATELLQPANNANPLLHHVLSQYKLAPAVPPMPPVPPTVLDDQSSSMQMDPLRALVQQMGGLQTLPNRLPQQPPMKLDPAPGIAGPVHGLPVNGTVPSMGVNNMMPPPKSDGGPPGKLDGDFIQFMQQHAAINKAQTQPPIEQRIDLESLWKRNQFSAQQQQQHPPPPAQPPQALNNLQGVPQWPQTDKPISMWDSPTVQSVSGLQQVLQNNMQPPPNPTMNHVPETPLLSEVEKRNKKEDKKQRELEERAAKKEAEEKRKQEQRKQELERRQQDEKRKKEEERIRKELDKAKREAEEKRQRELAEKKRLKELRKEEEARKKVEEQKRQQEEEKERLAQKERDKQAELQRQYTAQLNQKPAKAAPWSQAVNTQGLSLAEIQKLERERKAEQLLIQQQNQQRQLQQALLEHSSPERTNSGGLQLSWANKPMRQNHVKSLAEIQAEEQDRLLKQKEKEKAAQKEKEALSPPTSTIWSGQTLTWNNSENTGFWDEPVVHSQPQPKQKQVTAHSRQTVLKPQQQQQQQLQQQQMAKQKPPSAKQQKRSDEHINNNACSNSNEANSADEFTNWCTRTLANMNTQVDIPTFVSFLRDIESALDVRDYCREYLGEKLATQQFAAQFLEKRRSFKPKQNAHKDDMCSPAPAITPSTQHSNNDFQEVKGKGKKCKKSKMTKVDARILGFNVTAAQDRINVGDRDYDYGRMDTNSSPTNAS